jgi:hypothetical protein
VSDWLVARINTVDLDPEQRERMVAWVCRVSGLTDAQVRTEISARAAVSQDEHGSYELHLSRFVMPDGKTIVDVAADRVWSEPFVIPLVQLPAFEFTIRDGVPFVAQIGDA